VFSGFEPHLVVLEGTESLFEIVLVEFAQVFAAGLMDDVAVGIDDLQPRLPALFHGSQGKDFQFQQKQPDNDNDEKGFVFLD